MMAISTKLGQDALLLEHLAIDEAINGLFVIEAQVKSQRDDLAAGDLIGSNVDFLLKLKDDGTRWWNGSSPTCTRARSPRGARAPTRSPRGRSCGR